MRKNNSLSNKSELRPFFSVWVVLIVFALCACSSGTGIDLSGKGAPSLDIPSQGLEKLPAYRATYQIAFDGQQGGKPISWEESWTQNVLQDPLARSLVMESTGESLAPGTIPSFTAELGNVIYWKDLPTDSCLSAFISTNPEVAENPVFMQEELAERLPPLSKLSPAGDAVTILGFEAFPYTFDESALAIPERQVKQGQVWLAADGGFVVKYHLELSLSPDDSGSDLTGIYTIDYTVESVQASIDTVIPSDCRLPLPDLGMTAAASIVVDLPGYLEYYSESSRDETTAFYQQAIENVGYELLQPPSIGEDKTTIEATGPGQFLEISIWSGERTAVRIIGRRSGAAAAAIQSGQPTQEPAAEDAQTLSPEAAALRVVESLGRLLGLDGPAALPSYHLEAQHQIPVWDPGTGTVQASNSSLSADVAGADLHFIDRTASPGGTSSMTEVFNIAGQEYIMNSGGAVEGSGMASLTWTLWPLDPNTIISTGATGATLTGSEEVAGRLADVYSLQGTALPSVSSSGLAGFILPVTSASGTVWVDQASGALLKAVLDYTADVMDDNGAVKGEGAGHLEITVSEVGMVSVALP